MALDWTAFGYLRAAAVSPSLVPADPLANAAAHIGEMRALAAEDVSLVLFPELSLSGYSIDDLLHHDTLHRAALDALAEVADATAELPLAVVVGVPLCSADGRLFNCAVVCAGGRVAGAVPKVNLPGYGEFYDQRWFASGRDVDVETAQGPCGCIHICPWQLFDAGGARFGIEVCEDLWAPQPTGAALALAGAELILNPSASNELVGKADYRRDLVRMASAQRLCGYLYASAGAMESSRDVVFGGHLLAAENGVLLADSSRFGLDAQHVIVDFDLERPRSDRAWNTSFANAPRAVAPPSLVILNLERRLGGLRRDYARLPFVPPDEHEVDARAAEIMSIQAAGLARRVLAARAQALVIGLSGGLDSALAYLVCLRAVELLDWEAQHVIGVTMPGPGTSAHTLASARALAAAAGTRLLEIPIQAAVDQHLSDLGHDGATHDVVFENAQARERTQLLFNLANRHGGIVVGTGDLSELALGWCTYNADHMASYNVNASVPKTLIAYLVRWYARHHATPELTALLERVLATPISPELIPSADANVGQHTETIVGPYELHDFFLFHTLRHRFRPAKILALARRTFHDRDEATLRHWLEVFLRRFFSQQFKRTTLPPGPKVGSVSLSPRGDWRMPDEASAEAWLADLAQLPPADR